MPTETTQTEIQSLVKSLEDKGYTVVKEADTDNDTISKLEALGYTIHKPTKDETETDKNGNSTELVEALKQYGFEPIKGKENEKENDSETKQETEKKQEKETDKETEKDTKPSVNKQVMFMLGTPTKSEDGKTSINEDTISVMTPEQIQENMSEIRQYILDNGGSF